MELKSIPNAVKAVEGRTVTGIASVFGNVDDQADRIWPGAFQKTIVERRPKLRHLWNHDFMMPPTAAIDDIREVGRDELPEGILQMAPEAMGGLQVTRTYLDTPRGNEVLAGIKAGAITEMSIGLDPVRFDFSEKEGERIRELREIRLWETTDTLWGANEATAAMKAGALDLLLKQLEQYLNALTKAGARHSAKDVEMLNAIHRMAVDLGATQCKGIATGTGDEADEGGEDDEKAEKGQRRAGAESAPPPTLSLTDLKSKLDLLELDLITL
jgi:HK97 family phage prohead protease